MASHLVTLLLDRLVQQAADTLGYESAGRFVTMFRKALGTLLGRYMAERGAGQA